MIGLEINDAVVLEQKQVLEQALSTNPKTQTELRKMIRRVINEARKETISKIHFDNGDPRGARQSVRTAVYKKILGANINIYNSRKAHGATSYEPQRHPSRRGGNRMKRSGRTQQIMSYGPLDRGFILRWVNSGTDGRYAGSGRNGRTEADKTAFVLRTGGKGWRGRIEPRNFFRGSAEPALVKAANALANMIDDELDNILNKKKN